MRILCCNMYENRRKSKVSDPRQLASVLRFLGNEVDFVDKDVEFVPKDDGHYDLVIVELCYLNDFGGQRSKRVVSKINWLNSLKKTKVCVLTSDANIESRRTNWCKIDRPHITVPTWLVYASPFEDFTPVGLGETLNIVGRTSLSPFLYVGMHQSENGLISNAISDSINVEQTVEGVLTSQARGREYNKQLDSFFHACDGSLITTTASGTDLRWSKKGLSYQTTPMVDQDEFYKILSMGRYSY